MTPLESAEKAVRLAPTPLRAEVAALAALIRPFLVCEVFNGILVVG